MRRRDFLGSAGALAASPFVGGRAKRDTRPNIVVVVVDDMRFDEFGLGGHPYLETPGVDALARRGTHFANAYHTTPLCSPNRACILTGQYASRHGIVDNTSRSYASHRLPTFARELQRASYDTAHVGKWHMGNDPTPRPGYSTWVSFAGQGHVADPELFEDGRLRRVPGYVTDLLSDRAVEFVSRKRAAPFMLYLGHKAIHPEIQQRDDGSVDVASSEGFVPAARHRGRYAGRKFPRRANYGPAASGAKPMLDAVLAEKRSPSIRNAFGAAVLDEGVSDETIQQRAEMMLSVDEGIGRLVTALEERGVFENTLFVFMSDNGSFFGEHGLSIERRFPYEESVRCPLVVSHPARVDPGRGVSAFALSIDIAPTLLDAAGLAIPPGVQGRSLLPHLAGPPTGGRDAFLIEYHGHENPFPWIANIDYRAVRFGRYKYIRWVRHDDAHELYDLEADPLERRNLADDPTSAPLVAQAREKLASLVLGSLGLPITRTL
jgi:arylsulfatase A-like enzyme